METSPAVRHPATGRGKVLKGLLALVALGLAVGHTWNRDWALFDIFMYLGAVKEFATSGLDASHPFAVNADNSPYLSPYTLVLGFASRLTGLSPVVVLQLAAIVNGAGLVAALVRFARTFTTSRWVGTILTITTLFCWGWSPWRWAGISAPTASDTCSRLVPRSLQSAFSWACRQP